MSKPLTADDILPLVACLSQQERVRLVRLLGTTSGSDLAAYRAVPPGRAEFSSDEDPLSWDAEGWDGIA